MGYDLKDKAVVLTGGSRGIGRSTAVAMAREGARLAVLARDTEALEETVRRVKTAGGQAVPIACDITVESSVQKGKRETGTAWLPKLTGALFKLNPPWCDRINRLFLPKEFR